MSRQCLFSWTLNGLIAGYKKAGEKALALLEGMTCATASNLRDVDAVAGFLRPVLASKQYGYETFLAGLVAKV